MQRLLILIIGYLFGSFQTAIILGRVKGMDIRGHGSGNAGATNTLRVLGAKSAILVFLGDMLKTVIVVLIVNLLFKSNESLSYLIITVYAGLGAILGHNWPIYFQFKGGKGIAVSIATLTMIDYRMGLVAALGFLIITLTTKYVSLGSIILTASAPITMFLFHRNSTYFLELIILITIIPTLAIFQHRANIKRLLNGTESKLGQKSKDR